MSKRPISQLLKDTKIGDIVNARLVHGSPQMSVRETVRHMQDNRAGYIVLSEGGRAAGIFTETDLVQKVLERGIDWNDPVSKYMSVPRVLHPDDSVGAAVDLMSETHFYHVPLVTDSGELTNVISVRTLIRFLAECYPVEVFNLPPNPNQVMKSPEGG